VAENLKKYIKIAQTFSNQVLINVDLVFFFAVKHRLIGMSPPQIDYTRPIVHDIMKI
jgi:hypothetical protein